MRWYEEYRERRYLQHASDSDIMQRAKDLISNITTLTKDGKLGALQIDSQESAFIWRLMSHVFEECRLRTGEYHGLFKKYGIRDFNAPKPTTPNAPVSAEIIRINEESTKLRRLFKLGKRKHIHDMLDSGTIRVAPASCYDDPSLGLAISDNELAYDLSANTFDTDIMSLDPYQVRLSDVFGDISVVRSHIASPTNYYVWCTSFRLHLRLFDDFDADSVLVIHDAGEFSRRFIQAIRNPLHGWKFTPCGIHYFDPYHPSKETRNVFACKHFKYLYQNEFRYVFLPPEPATKLKSFFVEIGPLHDIAEAIDR